MTPGNQRSARPPRARTASPPTPPQELYVLSYDAHRWSHPDTTDTITRLDGTPLRIAHGERATDEQRSGVLGIFRSEAHAQMTAHAWLHTQLKAVDPTVPLPLPAQDGSKCEHVAWKTSGWLRAADGSRVKSVSEACRRVELVVLVSKSAVTGGVSGARARRDGQRELVAGERMVEDVDLTGTGERNARKRKRTAEAEESAGSDAAGLEGGGGRRAVKRRTTADAEMSEAADLLLSMKGGKW